jgi:hypothetical protein
MVVFTGKEANPINGIKNNVVRIINLIFKSEFEFSSKVLCQKDFPDKKF